MIYLFLYGTALVVANLVFMRQVDSVSHVTSMSVRISAAVALIYQLINFLFFGLDPFVVIAIAVQFLIGFLFSFLFGRVWLKVFARGANGAG